MDEAQKYGRINLYQSGSDRTFSFSIRFNTDEHIELKAESGFRHKTIKSAVIAAIERAIVIVDTMKNQPDTESSRLLLQRKT